jgi:hypothetical protein
MNDLDVAADGVPLVVPCDEHDHAVLDEYIAVPALDRVAVSDAQYLSRPRGLSCCHVHEHEQLLPERNHTVHVPLHLVPVNAGTGAWLEEPLPHRGVLPHPLEQPPLSIHGHAGALVLQKIPPGSVVGRVVAQLLPRNLGDGICCLPVAK